MLTRILVLLVLLVLHPAVHADSDLSSAFEAWLVDTDETDTQMVDTFEILDPNDETAAVREAISTCSYGVDRMTVEVPGIREDEEEAGDEVNLNVTVTNHGPSWDIEIDTDDGHNLTATFTELGILTLSTNSPPDWSRAAESHVLLVELEGCGAGHFTTPPPMGVLNAIIIPNFVGTP